MSNRFDSYAKNAARSGAATEDPAAGLTRRQALIGGAVMTGVAWTAPALLSATPAWAVASCAGDAPRCKTPGALPGTDAPCCPPPVKINGKLVQYRCDPILGCIAPGDVGGNCTNAGAGTSGCNSTSTKCNNKTPNICGGPGSQCLTNADCGTEAPNCTGTAPNLFCSA